MKHYRLIWKNFWRNRTRAVFTSLSIVVAFLLFGLLHGVGVAFGSVVKDADLKRLYVASKFGFGFGLPIADLDALQKIPGLAKVAYATWFGGYYQTQNQTIFSLPVDPARYFNMYPEIQISRAELETFEKTRTGAVISQHLAAKYGWSVGDRVPLHSSIWPRKADGSSTWTFDIVGIFNPSQNKRTLSEFLFNQDYFDEARLFGQGRVGWYIVEVDDAARSAHMAAVIDRTFENSADETLTQNEQEAAQSQLKQRGDVNLIVDLIIGAVFFTLLLLTANTMLQSVRERVPEFAVLKTIGYSKRSIAAIVVGEALLICVTAAIAGLILAWCLFPLLSSVTGLGRMPIEVIVTGIGISTLLAIVTGVPSLVRLSKVNVVDALAGR